MAVHLEANPSATHHVPPATLHPTHHFAPLGRTKPPSRSISASLQPIPVAADPFAKKPIGINTCAKQAHPSRGVSGSRFPCPGQTGCSIRIYLQAQGGGAGLE